MFIVLTYIFVFIILLFNQSIYIFGGDSAEFSLIAKSWSVAHPPGYPFYSLIINLTNRLLPFGTTPWRIATISSFSTIITSILIYLLLKKLKINRPIALFSSLFYIVLFPVWEYTEIPEVFTLHNLFVVAITYFIFQFLESRNRFYIYIAAFLCGLCVSHHHIFVLFIPAWVYLLYKKQGAKRPYSFLSRRHVFNALILFLIGCSFYLYTPIASYFSPPLDWENAKTISGFIRLITRAAYGTFKAYTGSSANILNQLYDIFSLFIFVLMDFRIIGAILIFAGFIRIRKVKQLFSGFLGIALAAHIFFLFYSNFLLVVPFTLAMYERFLIPLYLILIFYLAFGLQWIQVLIKQLAASSIHNKLLRKMTFLFLPVFMIMYFLIVSLQNYKTIRLIPKMNIFAVYAKNLLDTPPKNSIFFVGADNSHFTSAYYHFGEHYRPDLKFVFINQLDKKHYRDYVKKIYPDIKIPEPYSPKTGIQDFISLNKTHGLYFENPYGESWKPYGLLWKEYDSEDAAISDSAKLVADNNYLWRHIYTIPELDENLKKILHLNVVLGQYLNAYLNYSRLLFATNHIQDARNAVALISHYQPNDMRTKFVLVNLYLYDKRCDQATKIVESVPIDEALRHIEIIQSLKDYYLICKPNDHEVIRRIELEEKTTKKALTDI